MKKLLLIALIISSTVLPLTGTARFEDISNDEIYKEAINFLEQNGIISGYPDGTFKPLRTLNRAEMLKILVEANIKPNEFNKFKKEKCFEDVEANTWYTPYICYGKSVNWVEGYENGKKFKPAQTVNFVEALKMTLKSFNIEYKSTDVLWFKGIVDEASKHNYIPHNVTSFNEEFKRDQMCDLITRILKSKSGNLNKYLKERSKIIVSFESIKENKNLADNKNGQLESDYTVKIDFTKSDGRYRDVLGVNKSPLLTTKDGEKIDLSEGYKLLGISEVRMHDDWLDICKIYKDDSLKEKDGATFSSVDSDLCKTEKDGLTNLIWRTNSGTNLNNPSNYDFSTVDKKVKMIDDIGAKLYLRLGESWNGPNNIQAGNEENFAQIASNIYKHYKGEFGTTYFTPTISAVEIHNEGDGKKFWAGDKSTYINTIKSTLELINSPENTVGAAGFVHGVNEHFKTGGSASVVTNFIEDVEAKNLDFFSAHYYGECKNESISNLVSWIEELRENTDKHGLAGKPIHITEWNIGTGKRCEDEAKKASEEVIFKRPHMFSYISAALLVMQDIDYLTHTHFYAGNGANMALFSVDKGKKLHPNNAFMAFVIHKGLKNSEKVKSTICKDSNCNSSYPFLENIAAKGFKTTTQKKILIINDNSDRKTISLELKGIAESTSQLEAKTYQAPTAKTSFSLSRSGPLPKLNKADIQKYINDSLATQTHLSISHKNGKNTAELSLEPYSVTEVEI